MFTTLRGSFEEFRRQTGPALMRNESEEKALSNHVEGLAASGTEAEHGEVIVE